MELEYERSNVSISFGRKLFSVYLCVDGLACETLMYCIQKSIGPKEWTPTVSRGWTKIFSRILDVLVPTAVRCEMNTKDSTEEILTKRQMTLESFHIISCNTHREKMEKVIPPTSLNEMYPL